MRTDSITFPLASSLIIHLVILALVSALAQNKLHRQEFQPIALIDLPRSVLPTQAKKVEATIETMNAPPPKPEKIKDTQSPGKTEMVKPEKALPALAAVTMDEIAKNPKWLSAQVPFAELSDRVRANPMTYSL